MKKKQNKVTLGREKYITYLLFVLPGFLLYLCFFVAPLFLGIYYSMLDWNGFSKKYAFIGLQNYVKALTDSKFRLAILFNLKYSTFLIIFVITISMTLSVILSKNFRFRTLVRSAFFMPAVLSMLTVSLIFSEIFYRAVPAFGELVRVEFLSTNILSNKTTAMFGVLFVHVWQGAAIPTVLLMSALQTVPTEIVESSLIDGASRWQQFWSITIPFLLPTLGVVLVLLLRDGLTLFDYVYGLTQGGPGGATRTITLLIYQQGFEEWNFSFAIAESLILSAALAAFSLIQITYTQKKQIY